MRRYLLLFVLFTACGCGKKSEKKMPPPPPKVTVAAVEQRDIPLKLDAIGHVRAYNFAEIKAQVEGELVGVHFEQGTEVAEGTLLLTIDPRPYEAALAQAEAMLAENMANLALARDKVTRYAPLVKENYVSQLTFDEYLRSVDYYEAAVLKSEAQIDTARINLSYCYIKSPFAGRIGKRLIDLGNLIPNDGSKILTMTQIQPIYIDFTISERNFSKIEEGQEVEIIMPDRGGESEKAKLLVIDNVVDESTGMIPLRAVAENPHKHLWPGQFVRARLILKWEKGALLIPVEATVAAQHGTFVYVVKKDGTAEYRKVELGERLDGSIQVLKGLEAHERVITMGQINVRNGKKVEVIKK